MRVLFVFQQEHSQLIPRVYKLLVLYYSLARYCSLSNHFLQSLHIPDMIKVDTTLEAIRDKLLPGDKKALLEFIEMMAGRVNKGI